MKGGIAKEAWPFVVGSVAGLGGLGLLSQASDFPSLAHVLYGTCAAVTVLMLFFFRDPARRITAGPGEVVSGADGVVRAVEEMPEESFLQTQAIRISVFLSIFDVHVNRSPVAGKLVNLAYEPGKHLFAFLDAASEYNEHSTLSIEGDGLRCLVRQIVGPVARRVVCWRAPGDVLEKGERIGIMKFGSRLDVYLPKEAVTVKVKKGDRVVAGRTVLATVNQEQI